MEENPTSQLIRSIAFEIVGISIMAWALVNMKHATSMKLTNGTTFVGLCLVLFGGYEFERWKKKRLAAKTKQRKGDAR